MCSRNHGEMLLAIWPQSEYILLIYLPRDGATHSGLGPPELTLKTIPHTPLPFFPFLLHTPPLALLPPPEDLSYQIIYGLMTYTHNSCREGLSSLGMFLQFCQLRASETRK